MPELIKYECKIQHHDGVDIIANLHGGRSLAIEYERPNTHTVSQIFEKFKRAEQQYDLCIVVCTAQNSKEIEEAVGNENYFRRGLQLKDYIDKIISSE